MKISELIKRLEEKKSALGDVVVQVCNEAGDWSEADAVETVLTHNTIGTTKKIVKVYISG